MGGGQNIKFGSGFRHIRVLQKNSEGDKEDATPLVFWAFLYVYVYGKIFI